MQKRKVSRKVIPIYTCTVFKPSYTVNKKTKEFARTSKT